MNAPLTTITIPALGAQLEGGFFHGVVLIDGQLWARSLAPKPIATFRLGLAPGLHRHRRRHQRL